MRANAPISREGGIAWHLASQPALWAQTAIAGMSSAALITQGLRYEEALSQAERFYPDADLMHIKVCLEHIESNRLSAEAEVRRVRAAHGGNT